MSDLKSLKDLNPNKSVNEEAATPVDAVTPVNADDYETPATEFDAVEEVVSEGITPSEIHHDDLNYVNPEEDTSLGTNGIFDFAPSINRRREFVTEKISKIQGEIEDEQLEAEIAEDSDPSDDADMNFDDDFNEEETVGDVITDVSTLEKLTTPSVPVKQNEMAKAAAASEPIKTEPIRLSSPEELPSQRDIFLDEDDFADIDNFDEDDKPEDLLQEKELNDLRSSIAKKLRQTEDNFDIKGFTIAKAAISVNTALEYDESNVKTFDWPLMSAGKLVSMKPFSGAEIDALNGGNARNRFNNLKDIYRELYNHISDPTKPEYEPWLKVTSFMDIPHLYMAAYKSSFHGANYIPFTCSDPKCNHIFLSDDVPIQDNMVKFKDDAAKLKFNEIMDNGTIANNCLYETRIIQVSRNYAIGFREPSIYNTIFENAALDEKFVAKYQKLLSMMVYIDAIYLIKDGTLIPIALKVDKNNLAKTTKYKISTYAKIVQKLPSDAYQRIISIISAINELGDEVTYQLPEVTCPKCSSVIPAEAKESTELLFNRHQLALIANS